MESETLLTAEEVAKLLRLRVPTIYAAAAAGRIPSVRLWQGRRRAVVRFRCSEIEAFLKEREIPTVRRPPAIGD